MKVRFINTVLACAVEKSSIRNAYLLLLMFLIIIRKRMGLNFGRIPREEFSIGLEYHVKRAIIKKRSRIHYSFVENSKVWELSKRVSKELRRNTSRMLLSTCDFLVFMVLIEGVLIIIFAENMWHMYAACNAAVNLCFCKEWRMSI